MYFIFIGTDRENCFDLRRATKASHSAYLDAATGDVRVLMSGPTLDEEGRECGSLMILEADAHGAVEAFFLQEPYHLAGLYGAADLRPWVWKRGNPRWSAATPAT